MAQKKITDLQLISTVGDDVNFLADDGIQSYRSTALQLKNFIFSDSKTLGFDRITGDLPTSRITGDLPISRITGVARYIVNTYFNDVTGEWYKVNNDGWVEQGQFWKDGGATSGTLTITNLIKMRSALYGARKHLHGGVGTSVASEWLTTNFTTVDNFQTRSHPDFRYFDWTVEGYGDSAAVTALGATPDY